MSRKKTKPVIVDDVPSHASPHQEPSPEGEKSKKLYTLMDSAERRVILEQIKDAMEKLLPEDTNVQVIIRDNEKVLNWTGNFHPLELPELFKRCFHESKDRAISSVVDQILPEIIKAAKENKGGVVVIHGTVSGAPKSDKGEKKEES